MKKKNKRKIIYHEPPMKYNIALHKFEPNLPNIRKVHTDNQIQTNPLNILIMMAIILGIIVYLISKI